MSRNTKKSAFSPATRILALALSVLVASGVVVYLVTFIMSLFGA